MFGFWKRKRNKRQIFRFWNGTGYQSLDPLEIVDAIDSDPEFNRENDSVLVDNGDRDATMRLAAAVCRAFKVQAFDGKQGMTIAERLDLYKAFGQWVGALKKNIESTPSLPPSSGLAKASPKLNGETTHAIADSCSTSPSLNGAAPTR